MNNRLQIYFVLKSRCFLSEILNNFFVFQAILWLGTMGATSRQRTVIMISGLVTVLRPIQGPGGTEGAFTPTLTVFGGQRSMRRESTGTTGKVSTSH